jgi:hypothetical protein
VGVERVEHREAVDHGAKLHCTRPWVNKGLVWGLRPNTIIVGNSLLSMRTAIARRTAVTSRRILRLSTADATMVVARVSLALVVGVA